MCGPVLGAGVIVVLLPGSISLSTRGSALMELMKWVNRMLPGRDKHFGLRWIDQGGLSEDVTFEAES